MQFFIIDKNPFTVLNTKSQVSTQKKSRPRKLECTLEIDRQFILSILEKELPEEKPGHALENIPATHATKD